jgi:hypothetical protein
MKAWKTITFALLTAVAITIALTTATAYAHMGSWGGYGGMMGSWGGGMMGGYSGSPYNYPQYQTQPGLATPTKPYQAVYPYQFGGGGCHGRFGWNTYGYTAPTYAYNGSTLTIDTAAAIAQRYLTSLGNPDLAIAEVEEYSQNFYVLFYEKSTGIGAFETLIDKYSGSIYPEMGPNMMWNTKYGMMRGGIMGGFWGTPTATMSITTSQAGTIAQQFLNAMLPGTTAGEVTPFYGYYHVDVLSAGKTYGMLSVNGYTGQVWFHNWHGAFIQEVELS